MKKFIQIKNICKKYNQKKVLKDVNFDIYEGEILALLGINGAGKTTLSGIISTLHPATSGEIFFNEKSIYENINEYRKKIGLCPQHTNLNSNLNVEQNIFYSGLLYGFSREESLTKTDKLIKKFELEEFRNSSVEILSGGYKQRVSIARSIVHEPKLLILDEPTVGLDPEIRKKLWEIILDLKRNGTSVILTTHYIEEADFLADRICILNNGKIELIEDKNNLKIKYPNKSLESIFIDLTGNKNEEQFIK